MELSRPSGFAISRFSISRRSSNSHCASGETVKPTLARPCRPALQWLSCRTRSGRSKFHWQSLGASGAAGEGRLPRSLRVNRGFVILECLPNRFVLGDVIKLQA